MKSGFLVVGLCLLASIAIGGFLAYRYRPELVAVQDLVVGLTYFMEENGGRFPASETEFRRSDFVENEPDGSLRILPRKDSHYRAETHGMAIKDLTPFQIAWGADLADLNTDNYGKAFDSNGKQVELICWPSGPKSGEGYTLILLGISQEIRGLTSRPSVATR
jgi:hypothetical protein